MPRSVPDQWRGPSAQVRTAGPGGPAVTAAPSDPRAPTCASKHRCPTRPGNPTSPTTGSPHPTGDPDRMSRSSAGSTTTPATPCTSAHTDRSPRAPSWRPSDRPLTCTDTPHPRSPTTAWSTPSDSPARADEVARTPSKYELQTTQHRPEELPTITADHLRQGREIPADPQEVAPRPTDPAGLTGRAAGAPERVRRGVQPPPTAPIAPPPRHPGDHLQRTAEGQPGR